MTKIPILVTGAHRSGTTWVGKMLAANPQTAYISEPLNVLHRRGVYRAEVSRWYQYITSENEAQFLPAFEDLFDYKYFLFDEIKSIRSRKDFLRMGRDFLTFARGKMKNQRALLKDPFAVFSAPWFAQKLNSQVVVTVRHPAAFASSLKRLNWSFDFRDLLDQPLLMRDYGEPFRAEMESALGADTVTQAAVLWNVIYRAVDVMRRAHPEFHIVRHEDVSLDPVAGYAALYESLGLAFSDQTRDVILTSSSSENPAELSKKKVHSVKLDSRANVKNWKKRLTAEEIFQIHKLTESVSNLFYTDSDW
ncbi:MAG: sulfotransferase domain-containing protein [Anaerolineales bacterium]